MFKHFGRSFSQQQVQKTMMAGVCAESAEKKVCLFPYSLTSRTVLADLTLLCDDACSIQGLLHKEEKGTEIQ